MNTKKVLTCSIGGTAVGTLLIAAVVSAAHPPAASAAAENTAQLTEVSQTFADPQKDSDKLPGYLTGERTLPGIDYASTHYAGRSGDAQFWIAANDKGEACIILVRDDEVGAYNCLPPRMILDRGASYIQLLDTTTSDPGTRAYLIPDGYSADVPSTGAPTSSAKVKSAWSKSAPTPLAKTGLRSQILVTTASDTPQAIDITTPDGAELRFDQ